MIYYELRIKIDYNILDIDTITKYKDKISLVQKQFHSYKTNNSCCKNIYLDAGFDLFIPKDINIFAGSVSVSINHGIKCAMFIVNDSDTSNTLDNNSIIPTAFYLYPRSSTGSKTSLRLSNSVGVIDSGYRGYIFALFDHRGGYSQDKSYNSNISCNKLDNDLHVEHIEKNNRLVQICGPNISHPIYPILVNDESELGFTERGSGGLGSTGK